MKEHTNKLSNCLSESKSKVIEYVNYLIKRRMMSFSAISLITLNSFNRKKSSSSAQEKSFRKGTQV